MWCTSAKAIHVRTEPAHHLLWAWTSVMMAALTFSTTVVNVATAASKARIASPITTTVTSTVHRSVRMVRVVWMGLISIPVTVQQDIMATTAPSTSMNVRARHVIMVVFAMTRTQTTMRSNQAHLNAYVVVITQALSANSKHTSAPRIHVSMEVSVRKLNHISVARATRDLRTGVTTDARTTSTSVRPIRARTVVHAATTTTARLCHQTHLHATARSAGMVIPAAAPTMFAVVHPVRTVLRALARSM